MTDLTLNVSRTINASAETLFNAWLDPKMLARFMSPGPVRIPGYSATHSDSIWPPKPEYPATCGALR